MILMINFFSCGFIPNKQYPKSLLPFPAYLHLANPMHDFSDVLRNVESLRHGHYDKKGHNGQTVEQAPALCEGRSHTQVAFEVWGLPSESAGGTVTACSGVVNEKT